MTIAQKKKKKTSRVGGIFRVDRVTPTQLFWYLQARCYVDFKTLSLPPVYLVQVQIDVKSSCKIFHEHIIINDIICKTRSWIKLAMNSTKITNDYWWLHQKKKFAISCLFLDTGKSGFCGLCIMTWSVLFHLSTSPTFVLIVWWQTCAYSLQRWNPLMTYTLIVLQKNHFFFEDWESLHCRHLRHEGEQHWNLTSFSYSNRTNVSLISNCFYWSNPLKWCQRYLRVGSMENMCFTILKLHSMGRVASKKTWVDLKTT